MEFLKALLARPAMQGRLAVLRQNSKTPIECIGFLKNDWLYLLKLCQWTALRKAFISLKSCFAEKTPGGAGCEFGFDLVFDCVEVSRNLVYHLCTRLEKDADAWIRAIQSRSEYSCLSLLDLTSLPFGTSKRK